MYEFGTFRLDENRGLLLDGDTPVPLTTKCLDTLLVLVRNSDQTVSKDVLLQTVWPGTFVEESNLTQHISMLRKALGEGPQDRRYIVTVPRQGYRFVAPVRELPPLDPTPPRIDPQPEPSPPALPTIPPSAARSRLWIAAASILLLLIVAGTLWRHRSSSVHALTEKDSVLLADFENSTGEPVFDGALKQAIAIELGQSPFLDLVSTDHVRDTLKFMGRSPDEPIRSPLAREVCQRASAKALIAGSIARLGNSYVLAVNAMNCADATTLAQQQFEASRKEDVLPLLGKAASKLRSQLGESLTSIQRFDTPIAQATTPSLEALKAYSLGLEARTRGTERDAIPLFERAIAIDPKFATAYAQLGAVYSNLGETPRAGEYTRQAFELSDNLSEREKLYITARYYNATGDTAKAIDTFQVWTRLYPRDWTPFNSLAARYQIVGAYEQAEAAASKALELEPNHYSPYANLALSRLALNHLEPARQACLQAQAAHRDSIYTHRVLFEIAYLQNDPAAMQRELDWAAHTERDNDMLTTEGNVLASAGKLRAAREIFARAWAASLKDSLRDDAAYSMASEALIEADFGNFSQAKRLATQTLELGQGIDATETAAEALAIAADSSRARALVTDLRTRFPQHGPLNSASLPAILAAGQLHHDGAAAAATIGKSSPFDLSEFSDLSPVYVRALVYLHNKDGSAAAEQFQIILDHPGINVTSPRHPLSRLGLARAYTLQNNTALARKAYDDFFALWSNADPDLPILQAARAEYQHLPKQN